MSHYVTIRTRLRERGHLLAALRDLGLPFEEGEGLRVRGDQRSEEAAQVVVHLCPQADIGFRRSGDVYEIVADWYRIEQATDVRRVSFLEALNRRYAYNVIRDQAAQEDLIVDEETLDNGDIVITLSERG